MLYLEQIAIKGDSLPDATEAVRMEMIEIDQAEVEQFACASPAEPAKAEKN